MEEIQEIKEEESLASSSPVEEPKKRKRAPRKNKAKVSQASQTENSADDSASKMTQPSASEEGEIIETPKKKKKKADKVLSIGERQRLNQIERKRNDERYVKNARGRLVSKKKMEQAKKNVQSRSMRIAHRNLDLKGQQVLIGKGEKGIMLQDCCSFVRQHLKDKKTDEEAEEMLKSYIKEKYPPKAAAALEAAIDAASEN